MKKTKSSLVELFSGVPMFKRVMEVLESKKFVGIPKDLSFVDRISIGVMSPLERACYTVLHEPDEKIKSLGKCRIAHLDSDCINSVVVEMEICPFSTQLLAIGKEYPHHKTIQEFMSALIESRLGARKLKLESLSLHAGFRIATRTKIDPPATIETFNDIKKMSVEKMLEVSLKGTFLEAVIKALETGVFKEEAEPIAEGEVYIREMIAFEKAVWTTYSTLFDTYKAKMEERKQLMKGDAFQHLGLMISISSGSGSAEPLIIPKDENHPDVIKVSQLGEEIKLLDPEMDHLNELLWNIVKSNIPQDKLDAYDTTGIRQEFKIVMFNED